MIDFLFSLPLWLLAVVLNVWLMGFAVASLGAFRRWVLPRLRLGTDASLFYGAAVARAAAGAGSARGRGVAGPLSGTALRVRARPRIAENPPYRDHWRI